MSARLLSILIILVTAASGNSPVMAADWPMWRYDASRSASSPENLPDQLSLIWTRQYTPRESVWEDPLNHDLMPFDRIFEPIVIGDVMILGFNDSDKIVGIDTLTGEERWRFYTGGPVRLAPASWKGRVFATSDDGCLYCLNASDGSLVWRFRGGPTDRKLLGNSRLISMWPARGGAVVADGTVYFASSIWPFMGTFIYAIDADSGEIVWLNDGNGSEFMLQPHNAPAFAGVAPQGSITVAGDRLIVPGGRSVPAVFDRKTGKFLYYQLAASGKTGGSFVCADDGVFFNHYREKIVAMFDASNGNVIDSDAGHYPVIAGNMWYFSGESITGVRSGWAADSLAVWKADSLKVDVVKKRTADALKSMTRWTLPVDATGDLILSGNRLYAAGKGTITAVATGKDGSSPKTAWIKAIDGSVERLVAANGRLFAVTLDGRVMAFGQSQKQPSAFLEKPQAAAITPSMTARAASLIERTGVTEGYALIYGAGDSECAASLAGATKLHVVVVNPNRRAVEEMRRSLDTIGLYGSRVAVLEGELGTFMAPQYMASLTIVNDAKLMLGDRGNDALDCIFESMRPYGGVAYIEAGTAESAEIKQLVNGHKHPGMSIETHDGYVLLKRDGPLAGSGIWTHNLGSMTNAAKSDDDLVRLPLGLLWFGGSSNMDVLPRHGHGPSEQVVGGRLFIEGVDGMSARDVYTGRVIWKQALHDLGTYDVYYDRTYRNTPTSTEYNQVHLTGANVRGTNYVATLDRVYVLQGSDCVVLDATTGEKLKTLRLPAVDPEAKTPVYPEWGYIGVNDNMLFGGSGFVSFTDLISVGRDEYAAWEDYDSAASKGIVAMDRMTGKVAWKHDSLNGFLHNGIAAGNGRIYLLDRIPPSIVAQLSRRGKTPEGTFSITALDINTGEVLWRTEQDVFGTFLGYSEEYDVLIESTRPSRDMIAGEDGKRMRAFKGSDGSVVWDRPLKYATFPILHGDRILTEGAAFTLLTGDTVNRTDPLTGNKVPWTWKRNYGCNYPVASEHLLTFRSGAAGFFDLDTNAGTGNFGGFKSGCSINLIAADGVLNAPDYTRTCSCPYQNQTSLAMVYMPDADIEVWTFDVTPWDGAPIKRVGVNFGAPGNRMDDEGTLWLDYPSVGGESPEIPVSVNPDTPSWYRFHSSRINADKHGWVAASGGTGIEKITVGLAKEPFAERPYTVRLYFAEPETVVKGERVFDVSVGGKRRIKNLDIAAETKAPYRLLVKEFRHIRSTGEVTVELTPSSASKKLPVVSGIEIIAEK